LLAIGSIFLGVSLLEGSLLHTGIFFVFVPSITVGYYFSTKCKNVITLPSILLLYIALGLFVLIPVDLWLWSQDVVYSDSIVEQEHYIPKEWDRLYPEGWFSKPEDLADGFHWLRTEEQLARNYDQNTFHVYNWLQWGMYTYDAWLDIPAEWYIFMKVYTVLTNIELSADSIKERSMIKVSSTNWEVKKFSLSGDLKIYEWGMWQYQGARFELRYMPLLAWVWWTQKLLEDYYIVDGWER
jgi:hypothetical protein